MLRACAQRLEVDRAQVVKLYNQDGVEVDDVGMVATGDLLFVSQGEAFRRPTQARNGTGRHRRGVRMVNAYRVGRTLGQGGFGTVRFGHHELTGAPVALKYLSVCVPVPSLEGLVLKCPTYDLHSCTIPPSVSCTHTESITGLDTRRRNGPHRSALLHGAAPRTHHQAVGRTRHVLCFPQVLHHWPS